jgi:hypothetical protein
MKKVTVFRINFSIKSMKFIIITAILEDPEVTQKWKTSIINRRKLLYTMAICAASMAFIKTFKQAFGKDIREFPIVRFPNFLTDDFDFFSADFSSACIKPRYLKSSWSLISSKKFAPSKYRHLACCCL